MIAREQTKMRARLFNDCEPKQPLSVGITFAYQAAKLEKFNLKVVARLPLQRRLKQPGDRVSHDNCPLTVRADHQPSHFQCVLGSGTPNPRNRALISGVSQNESSSKQGLHCRSHIGYGGS